MPAFADLPDGQIAWLADHGEIQEYESGELVFELGHVAEHMIAVLEGAIEIVFARDIRAASGRMTEPVAPSRSTRTWTAPATANITLERVYSPDLPLVNAFAGELNQAWTNPQPRAPGPEPPAPSPQFDEKSPVEICLKCPMATVLLDHVETCRVER